ncbi:MAG: rRNA adenine N-6-methyltransferase family protein, partial [Candidatus Hodarchaeales archaeon]
PYIIITVQKEFGLRLIAQPGTQTYSRLSVMTQLYTSPQLIKIFPPSAFYPPPKVAHAVVSLRPLKTIPNDVLEPKFSQFMLILFNRKNKKAINNFKPYFKKIENKTEIINDFKSSLLVEKRVKDLNPQECLNLYRIWKKIF